MKLALPFLLLLVALAGCNRGQPEPPPRVTEQAQVPVSVSRVQVPVSVKLSELEALLEKALPQTLKKIDQREDVCIPAQHITICLKHERKCKGDACKNVPCKVGIKKAELVPPMGCRIVGEIRRGPIRLSGHGEDIHLSMPVSAEIAAQDVGNVISETADAKAEVRAIIRLGMTPDWQPTAKAKIDYSWTKKPGIELLGQRITFADKADPEVEKLLRQIEQKLPAEISKLQPRDHLEELWKKGFTSIELNRKNPPVWMRLTPQRLDYGGYNVVDGRLDLKLELEAKAETFVGDRPADPVPTPLPPSGSVQPMQGFRVTAPVIASYSELEPVLEKALGKLEAKGINVPGVGPVKARFGKPTIYATKEGKLALGLAVEASLPDGNYDTKGIVWLTGTPYNDPNSPIVKVRGLQIDAETTRTSADLLLSIANAPAVRQVVEEALAQNFANDIAKLQVKINKALSDKRVGDFVLNAQVGEMNYGVVQALGQGAYLPVTVTGTGSLELAPRAVSKRPHK